jgi:hypothetical protein
MPNKQAPIPRLDDEMLYAHWLLDIEMQRSSRLVFRSEALVPNSTAQRKPGNRRELR